MGLDGFLRMSQRLDMRKGIHMTPLQHLHLTAQPPASVVLTDKPHEGNGAFILMVTLRLEHSNDMMTS